MGPRKQDLWTNIKVQTFLEGYKMLKKLGDIFFNFLAFTEHLKWRNYFMVENGKN